MRAFNYYRWTQFAIVGSLYFLVCLHRVSPTVIARDLAVSFNADAVVLGIIASSYFYLYSAVQPVVGYLSDTIGPRKVITYFSVLAAIGALIFGAAPNATVAALGRSIVGAGVGGVFIPSLKLFSQWYRVNEFASLTGIMIAIGGIGALAAALPLTYLVLLLGWRGSFVGLGLISLVLAIICWAMVRDTPAAKGWPSLSLTEGAATETQEQTPLHQPNLLKRLKMILRSLDFWMITLSMFFTGGVFLTFQGLWAVPCLMDVFHLSRVHAGWLLMILPLGFAVGGPALGFFTDRLNLNRKSVLLWAIGLSVLGWMVLLFFHGRVHIVLACPLFFIFGLSAGGTLPICFTITRDLFPPWLMGTAVGLMNPSAFFGAALYQPFSGYLLNDFTGLTPGSYTMEAYRQLFLVFLISYAAAFLCILFLSHQKGSSQ